MEALLRFFVNYFWEARALCTIYLFGASYSVEDILHNISKLIHLCYLRIKLVYYHKGICLPAALS